VILNTERHLTRAEITVHYYDHPLVGIGSDGDTFTALTQALEKIEKQLLKQREKWRDTKRGSDKGIKAKPTTTELPPAQEAPEPQVYRVKERNRRKPMSVDEAVLELNDGQDYVVYRDSKTDRVSVLLRRRDGHFDLIES
jgi:putative sigma-54 modulation protein